MAAAPAVQAVPPITAAELHDAITMSGRAIVYGVLFEINKAYLRPQAEPVLQEILALLTANPELKLEIQVHTDNSFRDVYARRPSYDRAQAIQRWLINKGVAPARLQAQGYGETKPLGPNRTAAERARNRRVELVKLP